MKQERRFVLPGWEEPAFAGEWQEGNIDESSTACRIHAKVLAVARTRARVVNTASWHR